jgi:hypothetical protein
MLWAPVALQSGSAIAMGPSDHHSQMIEKGHCDEGAAGDQSERPGASHACCAGLPTVTEAPSVHALGPQAIVGVPDRPLTREDHPSFQAELPTPPPRRA